MVVGAVAAAAATAINAEVVIAEAAGVKVVGEWRLSAISKVVSCLCMSVHLSEQFQAHNM